MDNEWHEQWNGVGEWNGTVSGITRTVEWRVQLNDADSGMVWTVEWRGQGKDVDTEAFGFFIPKITFSPHTSRLLICFETKKVIII